MGIEIDRTDFDEGDAARFAERLQDGLAALRELLDRFGFGAGDASIGAELELVLIDTAGRPLPINRAVLADSLDPGVALELDQFNLEFNSRPVALAGRSFSALGGEIESGLQRIERAAALHGGRAVAIGILPTLEPDDLQSSAMSDSKRASSCARFPPDRRSPTCSPTARSCSA
jgi:hypothetical protein